MDGADVNEKDSNDTSFLWQVIDSRKHFSEKEVIDIVDLLIKKGVNVHVTVGHKQATVLHQTAGYGLVSLLEKFIQASADVNVQDRYGNTPLINVVKSPHKAALKNEKQLVGLLLSYNADRDIKKDNGKTAYDCAKSDEIKKCMKGCTWF